MTKGAKIGYKIKQGECVYYEWESKNCPNTRSGQSSVEPERLLNPKVCQTSGEWVVVGVLYDSV
jgi:hypothetical protein